MVTLAMTSYDKLINCDGTSMLDRSPVHLLPKTVSTTSTSEMTSDIGTPDVSSPATALQPPDYEFISINKPVRWPSGTSMDCIPAAPGLERMNSSMSSDDQPQCHSNLGHSLRQHEIGKQSSFHDDDEDNESEDQPPNERWTDTKGGQSNASSLSTPAAPSREAYLFWNTPPPALFLNEAVSTALPPHSKDSPDQPVDAALPDAADNRDCINSTSVESSEYSRSSSYRNGSMTNQQRRIFYSAIGSFDCSNHSSYRSHSALTMLTEGSDEKSDKVNNDKVKGQLHQAMHVRPYQSHPRDPSREKKDVSREQEDERKMSPLSKKIQELQQKQEEQASQSKETKEQPQPTNDNDNQRKPPAKESFPDNKSEPSKPKLISALASRRQRRRRSKKSVTVSAQPPIEMFRPSCEAYTPRMDRRKKIEYKPAELRTPQTSTTSMGTISRPNFRDALRRVAMIIQQHIVKIERRFENGVSGEDDTGLFLNKMRGEFAEENFATPRYKCTMVRVPMARPGAIYSLQKIKPKYTTPTCDEIYEFAHQLFKTVQLSSECSIVCLIYMERLMEVAKVPLTANTWRPIFMCGLLLASKVWQDLSSWNIEFASVYPQFSLDAINKLELLFLRMVKWDLYISSSLYAKYYFALRSILEKKDFRQRYNRMVGGVGSVDVSEALKIQKRSEMVKEEALQLLSRSM